MNYATWWDIQQILWDNEDISLDTVTVYDKTTGRFLAADLIKFEDDEIIPENSVFLVVES